MESTPQAYAAAFRRALSGWEELVAGYSPDDLNRRPAPDKWSAMESMEHLNIFAAVYLPRLEDRVAAGGPAGRPPFRYGILGRFFIRGNSERVVVAVNGLKSTQPAPRRSDPAEALSRYRGHTTRFLAVLDGAEGVDLSRIRMASPFLPALSFVRFPIGALLEGLAGHELRHLAQAQRAVAGVSGESGESGEGESGERAE